MGGLLPLPGRALFVSADCPEGPTDPVADKHRGYGINRPEMDCQITAAGFNLSQDGSQQHDGIDSQESKSTWHQ